MRTAALGVLVVVLAVGCERDKARSKVRAESYFQQKCVVCHGERGIGDGPGAAALDPRPRAFSREDWQASVTDDAIAKTIVYGGAATGKSAAMPPNPDIADDPQLVDGLVKIVRGFRQPAQGR
jgi:mono/diheme cytochrome c family protein